MATHANTTPGSGIPVCGQKARTMLLSDNVADVTCKRCRAALGVVHLGVVDAMTVQVGDSTGITTYRRIYRRGVDGKQYPEDAFLLEDVQRAHDTLAQQSGLSEKRFRVRVVRRLEYETEHGRRSQFVVRFNGSARAYDIWRRYSSVDLRCDNVMYLQQFSVRDDRHGADTRAWWNRGFKPMNSFAADMV
jgi:hypothetical protein